MTFKPIPLISAVLMAASLLLAGCKDAPNAAAVKAASTPVSIAAIAAESKGFTVGSPMSTRTVYVFFDAQCPHCVALWEAAKPLKSQAKFVWIPVGILNLTSTAQGATLLAAADPVAAMNEHETSMQAKKAASARAATSMHKKLTWQKTLSCTAGLALRPSRPLWAPMPRPVPWSRKKAPCLPRPLQPCWDCKFPPGSRVRPRSKKTSDDVETYRAVRSICPSNRRR
ncbi:thioredoxin domain-containing protein [Polaromonas sp. P1-6]|nr:thioredoxin domain-containing protein [Polaromonas sp. P1-6]